MMLSTNPESAMETAAVYWRIPTQCTLYHSGVADDLPPCADGAAAAARVGTSAGLFRRGDCMLLPGVGEAFAEEDEANVTNPCWQLGAVGMRAYEETATAAEGPQMGLVEGYLSFFGGVHSFYFFTNSGK